ncbi:MAG: InlB B-repeat-containing protein, partial [Clostridia bacterium]|nr:InlB B-repeat-containing protein [Clostridia bacterium]
TNSGITLKFVDVTFTEGNSKWSALKLAAGAKVEWDNVTVDNFNMKFIEAANALAEGSYVNNLTIVNNTVTAQNAGFTALPGGHTVIDGLVVKNNTTTTANHTLLTINGGTLKNVVMTNNTFAGYGLYSSNGSATTTVQNIVAYGNTSTPTNGWSIFQGQNASSLVFDGKTIAYTEDANVYQNGNAMAKGQFSENFVGLVTVRYNVTQPIFQTGVTPTDEQIASVHSSSYATGSGVLSYNKDNGAYGSLTKSFYTPAYSANNAAYGTVFGGTTVDAAFGKVNVVVIPADGYELTGFTDAEGNELEYTLVETEDEALVGEEIYTVTLTGDVDVVAVFNGEIVEEPTTYTITFVVDDETFGTVEVVENEEIVYTATPTKDGHEFAGWALAEDGEVVDSLGVADEAKTFYAIFNTVAPTEYTITFVVGEDVTGAVFTEGDDIVYNGTPEKEGYTFVGWTDEENGTTPVELGTATEDKTFYAIFEIKTYTITFVVEGLEDTVLTVNHGVVPEIADPEVDGFTFIGWDPEIVAATADATYTAILEAIGGGDTVPVVWGDVNLDGVVDGLDAADLAYYVVSRNGEFTDGEITRVIGTEYEITPIN